MAKEKLQALLRAVLVIVVSLVIGFNLYSWNARSLTGNVLPMPFGYGAAVVLSGSMEPAIAVDDLIVVKAAENYEAGDVVVYQTGYLLVVHRIVEIDENSVITRGDANNVNDEPVEPVRIKGKVIACIPHVGTAVRMLKTPAATIALIVGVVLTIELPFRKEKEKNDEQLQRIKDEIRRLKEEQEQ